jgi:hypothetical protein
VFQRCGSEILDGVQTAAGEGRPAPAVNRHPDCLRAYRRWLASIQTAGVF